MYDQVETARERQMAAHDEKLVDDKKVHSWHKLQALEIFLREKSADDDLSAALGCLAGAMVGDTEQDAITALIRSDLFMKTLTGDNDAFNHPDILKGAQDLANAE